MEGVINNFKNRLTKAKDIFIVDEISKNTAKQLIEKYHYLGKKSFMFSYAYGIRIIGHDEYLGACVFGIVQGISSLKGWFGLDNSETNIYELHRLVMKPELNNTNATSYLLSKGIKMMKSKKAKAIISLADSSIHIGYIYQACNFKYYGLTDKKTDFYAENGKLNPRGTTSSIKGVWLPRTQKHRYCYLIDEDLKVKYNNEKYPKNNEYIKVQCCKGENIVFDKRYNTWYTCPKCVGELKIIN